MLEARSPGGGSLQAGGRKGLVAHCTCAGVQWARDSRCVGDVYERAPGAARVLLHLARVWSQPTEIGTFQISVGCTSTKGLKWAFLNSAYFGHRPVPAVPSAEGRTESLLSPLSFLLS
jgi:hypothetical protein